MVTRKRQGAEKTGYHHGDLSRALRALAVRLIAENGVDAFSLSQAARLLGVTPSAAYRHYADKSALLKAVCIDGFHALGHRWLELMAVHVATIDSSPQSVSLARFSAGADAYFLFALENPMLFRLMYGPFGTGANDWTLFTDPGEFNPYAILGQTLDELVQAGVVSAGARVNGEVVAFSAIHGVAELAISGAFGRLSEVQLWGQLEQVKRNLLLGLRNEEVLVAPPTRSHVDPQSKRRTLRRALT
jgi:AcrR family transcriptional regulator